jgi:sterol desaturase/sphingolipid hydroxylase (fatty acid hydroxylase superfamily)
MIASGKFQTILDTAEMIALATVMAGYFFAGQALQAGLLVLAVSYLIRAYVPAEIVSSANEEITKSDLVVRSILPKVMWISCALCTVGFLMYVISLEKGGQLYMRLLTLGGYGLGIMLVLLLGVVLAAKTTDAGRYVLPVVTRAVPVFLAAMYLLYA